MFDLFATWLVYQVLKLNPESHGGQAVHFFVDDTFKILFLLLVMTFAMGLVNSYLPIHRIRDFLNQKKLFGFQYLMAAIFGAITPFCSCSSIPLFIGFLKGGIPLGVTLAFLITSPLVNEVALAIFLGLFGWKVTLIYAGSGILMGTVLGWILGSLRLERYLSPWVIAVTQNREEQAMPISAQLFWPRVRAVSREAWAITKSVTPYVLVGIAIGAGIHGFVPTDFFEPYIGKQNIFAVPTAVALGIPLYANATGVIPILQALVTKGIPLGTALAFSMAVVGLSIPEGALLKKVMTTRLIAIYFGSVGLCIVLLGYFFNIIL